MTYKLGKRPVKIDPRNIKLAKILKILPPIPSEYDFDKAHGNFKFPTDAWGNAGEDAVGDCVEVASYSHQVRAESIEQSKIISITREDVVNQYFKESGGLDYGLVMLDHMKEWVNNGLRVGGRKLWCLRWGGDLYRADAFAEVNPKSMDEVYAAIYLLYGVQLGIALPMTAQDQIGKVWDVVDGPGNQPGSWGGHAVDGLAYSKGNWIECFTWGERQPMTIRFFQKYCDEIYALVDSIDDWIGVDVFDIEKLRGYLAEVRR
jgi:hypothetical protein